MSTETRQSRRAASRSRRTSPPAVYAGIFVGTSAFIGFIAMIAAISFA